jgi:hypothetical protein
VNLEIESTRSLHVFVLNKDDRGQYFLLFPLPYAPLTNPLAAGESHLVPGVSAKDGILCWVVTSEGKREHLLVVASPEPMPEFEKAVAKLPRPKLDQRALPIDERTINSLRGIGGLAYAQPDHETNFAEGLFANAPELSAEQSVVAGGPWIRRITLRSED